MKIAIAKRLMPFSHVPGAACLIPGTCVEIEAFPTLLKMGGIKVPLKVTGPVRGFTLQQDLERDCVWVFGRAAEGFFRLKVKGNKEGVEIIWDRKKREIVPMEMEFCLPEKVERLSLGSHKAQDWDLVWRRFDLREIVPVLYMLGQKVPARGEVRGGVARLLEFPEKLEAFCRAGFSKILVPRLNDEQHQGLSEEDGEGNRYVLLREAFQRIRALFFRADGGSVSLLPDNPFDAGRLVGVRAAGIGEFDLEWAADKLRRAVVRAERTGEVKLQLQGWKSFRVRRREGEKGRRVEEKIWVEAGKTYLLDRFQK